ncbi:MAG: hypothetical protein WDN29_13380 [Methylovirgula sp.]
MRLRPFLLNIGCIFSLFIVGTLAGPSRSFASDESWGVPAWLRAHIGEGEDDIAPIVLQRARALYLQKVHEGAVRNSCYFAMDATRPNDMGGSGHRFYVICESSQSFRAISAGHGGGRNLGGVANFANGRRCIKNFGNAMDSDLTAGGAYVTSEMKTSFKGYYRASAGQEAVFTRAFLQFDGEGETANARERRVGGHAAVALKGLCLMKRPSSPYADQDGYVPRGTLVEYSGGRSDGCTSWTPSDARQIMSMVRDDPTTLYIYPDAADIRAAARGGSYWNASCLREIGSPRFWSRETLEPLLAEYKQAHPAPPPRPIPICKGP